MIKKIEVTVRGVSYPCRPTMGAMLRFKKETGKDITEIQSDSFADLCVYLYCCVASASAADGVEFNMSLMEFADALDPETMSDWVEQIQAPQTDTDEKKS